MKTYSVKEIAEKLNTNPETVRRWIRDNKLKAIQTSRKKGNIISEYELVRFLNTTARSGIRMRSPALGITSLLGTASIIALNKIKKRRGKCVRIEDVIIVVRERIDELKEKKKAQIRENELLIRRGEEKVKKISDEIDQLSSLLENEQKLSCFLDK